MAAMTPRERCLQWTCAGNRLLGILAEPAENLSDMGVLIVVGGPQYRAGSHRQFTLLARHLAAQGYPCLRFDSRGMGDSEGEWRGFDQQSEDIASAIAALQNANTRLKRVVILGLCDAASAALIYLQHNADPRVCGLALLNPWVRSEQSLARTQVRHYYLQRLADPAFWRKLLRGDVALGALLEFLRKLVNSRGHEAAPPASFQRRMALGWEGFQGSILLMLSGDDYTAKEFIEYSRREESWQRALRRLPPLLHELADANHTFASAAWRGWVEQTTLDWLDQLAAPPHQTDDAYV